MSSPAPIHTIPLGDYNIHIGKASTTLAAFLKDASYSSLFVLVDENTLESCWPLLVKLQDQWNFKLIEIQSGEIHKNLETCQHIWTQLMQQKADRKSLLINLGGGVIGDMGGFAASTFKRGIDFLQIPTTLLSQVDASIGGKLGIDFEGIKNSIGLFKNPKTVLVDPIFLQSLPERQIKSGFAEIIKHALIADTQHWQQLQELEINTQTNWTPIIENSLYIKKKVVESDPFEHGERKILNYGHTIGHAFESYALENATAPLLHGEAIALGMIAEAKLAQNKGMLDKIQVEQIENFVLKHYHYISYSFPPNSHNRLLELMSNDKKNKGEQVSFSLLSQIGKCEFDQFVSKELVKKVL